MMLFVQVILGGSSTVLGFPVIYHIIWGVLTFGVLIVATVLAVRQYGSRSTLFKVAIAAIVDFVVQGVLGLIALGSDAAVVVHLTNAFLLAVFVTYLISFADSAEKASTPLHPQTPTVSPGTVRALSSQS
jgi:heme A synthase